MTYLVTAHCSCCSWRRVGLTPADLLTLGWKRVEVFRTSWRDVWTCPACVRRQEQAA